MTIRPEMDALLKDARQRMSKAVEALRHDLSTIRTLSLIHI